MPTSAPASPKRCTSEAAAQVSAVTVALNANACSGWNARLSSVKASPEVTVAPSRQKNQADATATAAISSAGRIHRTIKGGWTTESTINTCRAVAIDEQSTAAAMSRVWVGIARTFSPIAPMVAALDTKPPKNPANGSPRPGPNQRSATCPRPLIASTSSVN